MSEPLISIAMDDPHRHYQPGDRLACDYQVDAVAAEAIVAIESSVLWLTSGKGDEDLGVHFFLRRQASEAEIDLRALFRFESVLPNSPLSYNGSSIKIHWLIRIKVFLDGDREVCQDLGFQLGSLPAALESVA